MRRVDSHRYILGNRRGIVVFVLQIVNGVFGTVLVVFFVGSMIDSCCSAPFMVTIACVRFFFVVYFVFCRVLRCEPKLISSCVSNASSR